MNDTENKIRGKVLSEALPTEEELKLTKRLEQYLIDSHLYESKEERAHREEVLVSIQSLLNQFVLEVARSTGQSNSIVEKAKAKLFTFGSFRLGVHSPGGDIDTLCVAPRYVKDEHFFNLFAAKLECEKLVSSVQPVPEAHVPIISFVYSNVSIDLLFVSLELNFINDDLDLLDDNILKYVKDEKGVNSINGCRVNDKLLEKIIINVKDYQIALKLIKKWITERGIYSNKMGYFGGVNLSILLAKISQFYPNATAAKLVMEFFKVYTAWNWPEPVMLCDHEFEGRFDNLVWKDPECKQLMPIITPAYPGINSSYNINENSKLIILSEFKRGYHIVNDIFKGLQTWDELVKESEFFYSYVHFLQITLSCGPSVSIDCWENFCESKFRHLVMKLSQSEYFNVVHLHPVPFHIDDEDDRHDNLKYKRQEVYYFIGLDTKLNCRNKVDLRDVIKDFILMTQSNSFYKDYNIDITHASSSSLPSFLHLKTELLRKPQRVSNDKKYSSNDSNSSYNDNNHNSFVTSNNNNGNYNNYNNYNSNSNYNSNNNNYNNYNYNNYNNYNNNNYNNYNNHHRNNYHYNHNYNNHNNRYNGYYNNNNHIYQNNNNRDIQKTLSQQKSFAKPILIFREDNLGQVLLPEYTNNNTKRQDMSSDYNVRPNIKRQKLWESLKYKTPTN